MRRQLFFILTVHQGLRASALQTLLLYTQSEYIHNRFQDLMFWLVKNVFLDLRSVGLRSECALKIAGFGMQSFLKKITSV